jgi:hypothetical protein
MFDYNALNPGIRETVKWLRERSYDTQDSGDGATRQFECDQPVPYVHIKAEPKWLVKEADRLRSDLYAEGIVVQAMNEEGTAVAIEASYNPADGFAIITLWNVNDAVLLAPRC